MIPVYRSDERRGGDDGDAAHVDDVVLVDDGAPAEIAALLAESARDPRVQLVRMGENHGKGSAVAAGIAAALERAPDAVVVLDSDGQHPPALIPDFVAAAERRPTS